MTFSFDDDCRQACAPHATNPTANSLRQFAFICAAILHPAAAAAQPAAAVTGLAAQHGRA